MRALLVLLAVTMVVPLGCGSEAEAPDARAPAADAPTAAAEPSEPPPKLDIDGPPPAWIETSEGSFWLAYSTFCWKTACADYIPPSCAEPNIPQLVVDRDEEVRFHLGFDPKEALVTFFLDDGKATTEETQLEAERDPIWTVDRAGAFALRVTSRDGRDASYAGCIRFTDGTSSSGVPAPGGALTVDEAIAFGSGDPVLVKGTVIVPKGDPPRLCSIVAESYPPQCGEPSLVLRGLDLETVPGIVTANGVSFTNEEIALVGNVHGKVLAVSTTAIASASG